MSYTVDLCTGIANILATAGVAEFNPSGVYADPTVGIVMSVIPQTPGSVISLSTYSLGDDIAFADSTVGLQVRCRHATPNDPRPVQTLDDAAFDALAGLRNYQLTTGIQLVQIQRTSSVPLGEDDSNRWGVASNYRLTLFRPTTHRL